MHYSYFENKRTHFNTESTEAWLPHKFANGRGRILCMCCAIMWCLWHLMDDLPQPLGLVMHSCLNFQVWQLHVCVSWRHESLTCDEPPDRIDKHSAQHLNLLSSLLHVDIQPPTMMSRSSDRFHLRTKASSHGNHMLPQVMSPRKCLSHENATSRAWSPHA